MAVREDGGPGGALWDRQPRLGLRTQRAGADVVD